MNPIADTLFIGIGATAISDVWGFAVRPLLGVAPPDYGLVGRWVCHMKHGRLFHASIATSPRMREEVEVGWIAHYLIGMAYAVLLTAIGGEAWLQNPTPGLALVVGLGTVAAPFLLMQPAMGAGIAASRMARPGNARLHSLFMHAVFGIGLFASSWVLRTLS